MNTKKPKQIVIKKPPSIIVKKKERGKAHPDHAQTTTSIPAQTTQAFLQPYALMTSPINPMLYMQAGAPAQGAELTCPYCGHRKSTASSPQAFEFFCPYCGQVNRSRGELIGKDIQCVSCNNTITIPPPPAPNPKTGTDSRTAPHQVFKFFCVYCGGKLSATRDMVGQAASCPHCNRNLTVPHYSS